MLGTLNNSTAGNGSLLGATGASMRDLGDGPSTSAPVMDFDKVLDLFTGPNSSDLYERHAAAILRLCKANAAGFAVRDLPKVTQILDLSLALLGRQLGDFLEPVTELVRCVHVLAYICMPCILCSWHLISVPGVSDVDNNNIDLTIIFCFLTKFSSGCRLLQDTGQAFHPQVSNRRGESTAQHFSAVCYTRSGILRTPRVFIAASNRPGASVGCAGWLFVGSQVSSASARVLLFVIPQALVEG